MLEKCFKQRDAIESLQSNPLVTHLDAFATSLADDSYAESTVRSKLLWIVQLGWWLQEKKVTVVQLGERIIETFLKELRQQGRLRRGQGPTILRFLAYLQSQQIVPCPEPVYDTSPLAELERQYERHLRMERVSLPRR